MRLILSVAFFLVFSLTAQTEEEGSASEAVFFNSQAMSAAFSKGQRLVTGSNYTASASRRDRVGRSEIHESVTDLFYFVSGRATFVTEGELVDAENTEKGEWRGSAIRGGVSRMVKEGDMIVVPKSTPHWFSAIDGVIEYYIVKVSE